VGLSDTRRADDLASRSAERVAPTETSSGAPATPTTWRVRPRVGSACAYVLILIASGFTAYWTTFSQFHIYDDEGYFDWSLRLFADGHTLYDSVFSYYGPFHYELWGGLSRLIGVSFSTNGGRALAMALWLGTSLVLGVTTGRLTGRLSLGLIVQVLSFHVLIGFAREPMYPGDTALLVVCALLATAAFALRARSRTALTLIGALTGAVLLTKLNVGGYVLIAVGYATVMSVPPLPFRKTLRVGATAAMVLVGPVVMAPTLDRPWTQRYAFLVAASAVALALVTARAHGDEESVDAASDRWLAWMVSGLVGCGAVVVGVILALGTTPLAMFDSVVVAASHQASAFAGPLSLGAMAFVWPIVAIGVSYLVRIAHSTTVGQRRLAALLRVAAGLALWYSVVGSAGVAPTQPRYVLGLPLVWVAAVRSSRDDGSLVCCFVRVLVPTLALLQTLIAYPVAGTQVAFGSVLLLVCGAICVADGWNDLQTIGLTRPAQLRLPSWVTVSTVTVILATVLGTGYIGLSARTARDAYNSEQALPFPGADDLRVPHPQAVEFTNIVKTLRARCQTVITLPGMLSLNLWSGLPAPSGLTQEPWWAILSPAQLANALQSARAARGLCLVRNDALVQFWLRHGSTRSLPPIPLVRFLENDFAAIARYGHYTISVRDPRSASQKSSP
jgi:hypothetical protein